MLWTKPSRIGRIYVRAGDILIFEVSNLVESLFTWPLNWPNENIVVTMVEMLNDSYGKCPLPKTAQKVACIVHSSSFPHKSRGGPTSAELFIPTEGLVPLPLSDVLLHIVMYCDVS